MHRFKAGKYITKESFRSFQPNLINRQWQLTDMRIVDLLSRADRQLGRLDMYSQYVPNIDLFISMHVAKEATQSSKIEGTRTGMEEALLDREHIAAEKKEDWDEVQNYIAAMNGAIQELERLPISTRLIRNAHATLMQGVRGKHKSPGEFRSSQNWIGGTSIGNATFVPPDHEHIPDLMSDLEQFIHNEDIHVPELMKIAIVHYQFETIHPFLDGNGRVGRLMIPLYLVSRDILKSPVLYLSDYFERNRPDYYGFLRRVQEHDEIENWIMFFLRGIIETAEKGIQTFDGILQLRNQIDQDLQKLGKRAANAHNVVQHLYTKPNITAREVSKVAEVSMPTAYKLLNALVELEILTEVTGRDRNRLYVFRVYLDLFT